MCSFSPASWKNKKFRKGIFRCISKRNKLTGEREGSRNLIFLFFLPWEKTSRVIPSSSSSAALSLVYLSISLLVLLCLSFLIFGTHGLTWLFAHMTRLWATRWWGFKLTTFRRLTSPLRNWRDFNGASIWISRQIGEGSTTHIPPIKSISPSKCYFNQIGFQFLIPTVLYLNGKAGRPGKKKRIKVNDHESTCCTLRFGFESNDSQEDTPPTKKTKTKNRHGCFLIIAKWKRNANSNRTNYCNTL